LAIVSKNKWDDPFFRSEVIVVVLQLLFALVLITSAYVFFSYFYKGIIGTVVSGITESVASGRFNTGDNLLYSLQIIKEKNFVVFSAISLALTAIFTFLIARMTLKPAKNALNLQKRFISDIAHELRTPLSIIKANSEVLLMDENRDQKVKHMLKDNIEELDRMSEIINNILSISNLVRPKRIKFVAVDMGQIVDLALRKLKDLAEKKHLEITVKKITPYIVWGSPVALEQIVINILKNAINYTPRNGHITIRISPDYYGNVLLHIEDTGMGISKKDLMHIFEPFYRAERSRKRSNGSSGLGLTIASELVKIHSGRITIKSAENKGTVAIVTLPYGRAIDEEENVDLSSLSEISTNFLRDRS